MNFDDIIDCDDHTHLIPFGYAPGYYASYCTICGISYSGAKRSNCPMCAERQFIEKASKTPMMIAPR